MRSSSTKQRCWQGLVAAGSGARQAFSRRETRDDLPDLARSGACPVRLRVDAGRGGPKVRPRPGSARHRDGRQAPIEATVRVAGDED